MTEEELRDSMLSILRRAWDAGRDPERDLEAKPKRGIGQGIMRKRRRATQYYLEQAMDLVQAFNNGRQP